MSLHVSIRPELTAEDITELTAFLIQVLNDENHEFKNYGDRLRCGSKLGVFYRDNFHRVHARYSHSWYVDNSETVEIGVGTSVSASDKLAVLFALMQYVQPQPEGLVKAASGALERYLLSEYNSLKSNQLTVSEPPATGIAFSETQVASLVDGVWMLSSGEEVDVSDGWTVCKGEEIEAPATVVETAPTITTPAAGEFVVGQRVLVRGEFPATVLRIGELWIRVRRDDGYEDGYRAHHLTAIETPVEAEVATTPLTLAAFHVGQRVHWTPLMSFDEGYVATDGTIERVDSYVEFIPDTPQGTNGRERVLATPVELSIIAETPTPTSTVGQRVAFDRIWAVQSTPGTGEIVSGPDASGNYQVRGEDGNIWWINHGDGLRAEVVEQDAAIAEVASAAEEDIQF